MQEEPKGYFNALTAANFKATPEGRRLFFPWGAMGTGYALPSEAGYRRLRRLLNIYNVLSLALIVVAVIIRPFAGIAVAALLVIAREAWMRMELRGLQRSTETMSTTEGMTAQARAAGPVVLWTLQIIALIFVATGAAMIVFAPGQRWVGLAGLVFFGACAVVNARLIMLRKRAMSEQPR